MTTNGSSFVPGLEGVVAFHTAIAEPDRDGGSLRYRGVDIDDLVGKVGFEDVWALLVDDEFGAQLPVDTSPPAFRSGDVRVDVQASLPLLAPARGFGPLLDITDEQARDQLAQTTVRRAVLRRPLGPRRPARRYPRSALDGTARPWSSAS